MVQRIPNTAQDAAAAAAPAASPGLEALAREIETGDAPPAGPPPGGPEGTGEQPAPQLKNAQCITAGLVMVRDLFCSFTKLTSPKENFTDDDAAALGQAWGAVADKYGLSIGGMMGDYALELTAIATTAGVVLKVLPAVRAEAAQLEAEKPQGGKVVSIRRDVPGGTIVTPAPAAAAPPGPGPQSGQIPPFDPKKL